LTVDQLDNKNMMTKTDVKKASEMGAIIGSHGMKHRYFNDLTEKEIFAELKESKKILSNLSGQEITLLSLPGGRSHHSIEKIMDETGYKYVFNSCPEIWIPQNQQKAIGRIVITKKYNFEKMQKLFNNPSKELKYNLLRFKILNTVKKIVGNKNYDRLRDMFL
jgi:peptidoglycan/xylan/chitin deacetylase (PgdA/CDA1 family)